MDFGLNLILGLCLGGVIVQDHSVVILPVTAEGVTISGSVLGAVITWLVIWPAAKAVWQGTEAVQTSRLPLPGAPLHFAAALMLPVMVLAAVFFKAVFCLFSFSALDFFQFFCIRTAFVALLLRPVVWLAAFCRKRSHRAKSY